MMSVPQIVLKFNTFEHWYLKCYYVKRDSVDITPTFNRVLHDDMFVGQPLVCNTLVLPTKT